MLITSALPCKSRPPSAEADGAKTNGPDVNNVPHLGNIIGSTLSADVFARYCRTLNVPTLYICGTDEYGTATETKALEEGVSPYDLCTKFHHLHTEVYEWFEIGFDKWGRTSTSEHTAITQEVYKNIHDRDYFRLETADQTYCEDDELFLADRFVEGTCPQCGYDVRDPCPESYRYN